MAICLHLWSNLAEIFLQYVMFQTKFLEKIKTRFMFNIFFFENVSFMI